MCICRDIFVAEKKSIFHSQPDCKLHLQCLIVICGSRCKLPLGDPVTDAGSDILSITRFTGLAVLSCTIGRWELRLRDVPQSSGGLLFTPWSDTGDSGAAQHCGASKCTLGCQKGRGRKRDKMYNMFQFSSETRLQSVTITPALCLYQHTMV